jgi:hypothetical protein
MRKRVTSRNAIKQRELELEQIAEEQSEDAGVASLVAYIADGIPSGAAEVSYQLPHHGSIVMR